MQKEVLLVRLLHGAWRSRVFFLQALRGFAPWNPTGFAVNHDISKRFQNPENRARCGDESDLMHLLLMDNAEDAEDTQNA